MDHLALHPQLETGNFIIKAVWLPGSQTELAVVTADFVKVGDLCHISGCLTNSYFMSLFLIFPFLQFEPIFYVRDISFTFFILADL